VVEVGTGVGVGVDFPSGPSCAPDGGGVGEAVGVEGWGDGVDTGSGGVDVGVLVRVGVAVGVRVGVATLAARTGVARPENSSASPLDGSTRQHNTRTAATR
jgi:hypothetical protein